MTIRVIYKHRPSLSWQEPGNASVAAARYALRHGGTLAFIPAHGRGRKHTPPHWSWTDGERVRVWWNTDPATAAALQKTETSR